MQTIPWSRKPMRSYRHCIPEQSDIRKETNRSDPSAGDGRNPDLGHIGHIPQAGTRLYTRI